uniref:Uncharacterized protein n=1 Tax=Setaria viridis TaxID=4556 RepID=A0A4U6SSV9_SETVI|nr:hypothetical protein SEVIR_9G112200v2 [Setaria viridis]
MRELACAAALIRPSPWLDPRSLLSRWRSPALPVARPAEFCRVRRGLEKEGGRRRGGQIDEQRPPPPPPPPDSSGSPTKSSSNPAVAPFPVPARRTPTSGVPSRRWRCGSVGDA